MEPQDCVTPAPVAHQLVSEVAPAGQPDARSIYGPVRCCGGKEVHW